MRLVVRRPAAAVLLACREASRTDIAGSFSHCSTGSQGGPKKRKGMSNMRNILLAALLYGVAYAALAQAPSGGAAVMASEPGKVTVADAVQVAATVQKIDKAKRLVTLKGPEGHTFVVQASAEGRTLALHVRDFGPGVPAEERARVFAPFSKGSAHEAGTKPGVGLGLALSRRLAEQMRGKLELRPSDRGADFVLSLPFA